MVNLACFRAAAAEFCARQVISAGPEQSAAQARWLQCRAHGVSSAPLAYEDISAFLSSINAGGEVARAVFKSHSMSLSIM